MTERMPTLQMDFNTDYPVQLLYDEPKTGESQYGKWHLYVVKHKQEQMAVFADEKLHDILKEYSKDDQLTIRRNQDDKLVQWQVKPAGNGQIKPDLPIDLRTRDIHRQVCLKLASQSIGCTTKPWTEYERCEIYARVNTLLGILEGAIEDDQMPF